MKLNRETQLFSGQGDVLVAIRDQATGAIGVYRHVGNVPGLELGFEVETGEIQENMTGKRLTLKKWEKKRSGTSKAQLHSLSPENLAMLTLSKSVTATAGTLTDFPLPAGLVAGDIVALPAVKINALTVKDDAGDPLIKGEHYDFDEYGSLQILSLDNAGTPFDQPLTVSGSHGEYTALALFSDEPREYAIRFQGLNTQDNRKVLIDLWRVGPDPIKQLALIADDPNPVDWEATLLADMDRDDNTDLGYFGRIVYL